MCEIGILLRFRQTLDKLFPMSIQFRYEFVCIPQQVYGTVRSVRGVVAARVVQTGDGSACSAGSTCSIPPADVLSSFQPRIVAVMTISDFIFATRSKDLAVAGGKTLFPLFDLLSVKGMSITFFCHCRMSARVLGALGYDPIFLAILLSFLCAAVIYGIKHHYFRKRGIDLGLRSLEDCVLE